MPVVRPLRLRPLLKLSLLLSLSTSPLFVPVSYAEDSAPRRSYQVPAGSLSAALTRFAGWRGSICRWTRRWSAGVAAKA